MTMPSSPPPAPAPAAVLPPIQRQPLGLPEGSVRALLALMVFGTIWALLVLHEDKPAPIPLHLYYLMFLILGSYFAARRHHQAAAGVRHAHPLHLPRGTLRFLMIVGFIAAVGWGLRNDPQFLDRLTPPVSGAAVPPDRCGRGVLLGRSRRAIWGASPGGASRRPALVSGSSRLGLPLGDARARRRSDHPPRHQSDAQSAADIAAVGSHPGGPGRLLFRRPVVASPVLC